MKNFYAITKSDLTRNEKEAAELLRELVYLNFRRTGKSNIVSCILELRKDYLYNFLSEKDLKVACEFHNVLNEYVETLPKK